MRDLAALGYVPVPQDLLHAASLKLAGKDEATVSLTSGGKLSRFAAQKRRERTARKRRHKQKVAAGSRRRNR